MIFHYVKFPKNLLCGSTHLYTREFSLDPFTLEIYAEKSKLRRLLSISKQIVQFQQEKFPTLI